MLICSLEYMSSLETMNLLCCSDNLLLFGRSKKDETFIFHNAKSQTRLRLGKVESKSRSSLGGLAV